jgi:hypothetical protein
MSKQNSNDLSRAAQILAAKRVTKWRALSLAVRKERMLEREDKVRREHGSNCFAEWARKRWE